MHTHTHTHAHARACATHIYATHTHTHTCTRTCTHTHTHKSTPTLTVRSVSPQTPAAWRKQCCWVWRWTGWWCSGQGPAESDRSLHGSLCRCHSFHSQGCSGNVGQEVWCVACQSAGSKYNTKYNIQDNKTLLPSVNTLTARRMFCGAKYSHHIFTPIIKHLITTTANKHPGEKSFTDKSQWHQAVYIT